MFGSFLAGVAITLFAVFIYKKVAAKKSSGTGGGGGGGGGEPQADQK